MISVIIGNPPFSVHSRTKYPKFDKIFKKEIIDKSIARQKSALNDPFYKSIFLAEKLIDQEGIIAFVVNNSWIVSSVADGFRDYLYRSFSSIYLLDLKGNIKKASFDKDNNTEGENIFGNFSQVGIVIAIFIKKKNNKDLSKIKYFNLGDNLKTSEKLNKLKILNSISQIETKQKEIKIIPNKYSDWLNQRIVISKDTFRLGDKTNSNNAIFESYTSGIKTNRDEWAINFSKNSLAKNMQRMILYYETLIKNPDNFQKSKSCHKKLSGMIL